MIPAEASPHSKPVPAADHSRVGELQSFGHQ